jgi:hypothetical protein
MTKKLALLAGLGLLALGLPATTAEAAPAASLAGAAHPETAGQSLVEKAHWYGRYHYGYRPYDYGYNYYPRYYYYPRYNYYPRYHYYPRYRHFYRHW